MVSKRSLGSIAGLDHKSGLSVKAGSQATAGASGNTFFSKTTQVRIQAGQWRRTPIAVVNVQGLRPTPDRVRETLFNWLGQQLIGRHCLDLFAGTGVLGFEAASRGAATVTLVESNRLASVAIRGLIERLSASNVTLIEGDALAALGRLPKQSFDVVFLDPPFDQSLIEQTLPKVLAVLKPNAMIYVESEIPITASLISAWMPQAPLALVKAEKAGKVYYHLLSYGSA